MHENVFRETPRFGRNTEESDNLLTRGQLRLVDPDQPVSVGCVKPRN